MAGIVKVGGKTLASHDAGTDLVSLDSGTKFPAGHIIQTHFYSLASGDTDGMPTRSSSSLGVFSPSFKTTITGCASDSKLLISVTLSVSVNASTKWMYFRLRDNTNTANIGTEGSDGLFGNVFNNISFGENLHYSCLYDPASFSSGALEVELWGAEPDDSTAMYLNRRGYSTSGGLLTSNFIIQEVVA